MKRWHVGSEGVNVNEGGYLLTFFWSRRRRFIRLWLKLNFWQRSRGIEWSRWY
jgi:hypothetical protein